MKRLKAINFVMMLVLLLQTLVIPLNVTQAASQDEQGPQVTSEFVLDKPELANGAPTDTPITVNTHIYVNGAGSDLDQGVIQITVPKNIFKDVTNEDIALVEGNQSYQSADVTSDDENSYINYHLNTIKSGTDIAIPFNIYFQSPNVNLDVGTLTQVVIDENGFTLGSSQSTQDLIVNTYIGKIYSNSGQHNYEQNEVVDNRTQVTVDKEIDIVEVWEPKDDSRDIKITVELPENMIFNEPESSSWQYNEDTREATRIIKTHYFNYNYIIYSLKVQLKEDILIGTTDTII